MIHLFLEIINVGINNISVPKTISEKVFERMIAECKRIADRYIAEGNSEARQIRISADRIFHSDAFRTLSSLLTASDKFLVLRGFRNGKSC